MFTLGVCLNLNYSELYCQGDGGERECLVAVNTLFGVLFTFVRIMAPFTPFLCELMYTNLRKVTSSVSAKPAESIHFLDLPKPVTSHIDIVIERRIKNMQYVISSGRIIRDKRTVPMKVSRMLTSSYKYQFDSTTSSEFISNFSIRFQSSLLFIRTSNI